MGVFARERTTGVKRLLVTGRHGFVGSSIANHLARQRQPAWSLAEISPALDLRDSAQALAAVRAAQPDAVIHLAAQSFVPESFRDPRTTLDVNLYGTLNLLDALRSVKFSGRLLFVGTGEIYGLVPEADLPIDERHVTAPRNPYAVSKVAAEALCYQWFASERMDIVLARPFNHIGAGQSDRFALSDFARQLAGIKSGRAQPVLSVGDIDVTRDFTAVDDVVEAYFALLDRGEPGETYNVCSGVERSVRSLLDRLIALSGIDVRVETDEARLRKSEQRRIYGNPAKIERATGWRVATPIDNALAATLAYWERQDQHG